VTDSRTFFDTISLFASGVTVVTIHGDDQPHGMTANAFTSLSANPMQIIVCIAKQARINAYLMRKARFTVNVLREDQEAISNQFAGATREATGATFRFVVWEGGPRIEGCLAAIGCELVNMHDGGDHWIVVGEVIALLQGIEPRKPLLYFNRRYHRLESDSSAAPGRADLDHTGEQMFYDPW
jgi:flavin reductase (DIM6/NTAB) family NADH-FMN oxidoreductase RutF